MVVQVEPFLAIVFLVGSKNKQFLEMSLRIPFYPEHKLWNSILNSQAHDDGQVWSSNLYYDTIVCMNFECLKIVIQMQGY